MSAELRELGRLARNGNVSVLPAEQRTVVILRLGWDGAKARTQQEVANYLGFSQPYISTLERHAKVALEKHAPLMEKAFKAAKKKMVRSAA